MKRNLILIVLGMLACAGCQKKAPPPPEQQQPYGDQQYGGGQSTQTTQPTRPNFNPDSIKTYRGQIVQVIDIPDPSSSDTVGLLIQTEQGTFPVVLGPRSFVGDNEKLAAGQTIEVTGSEFYVSGTVIVIAQQVTVGDYTLKLRDKDGNPLWTAWQKK